LVQMERKIVQPLRLKLHAPAAKVPYSTCFSMKTFTTKQIKGI